MSNLAVRRKNNIQTSDHLKLRPFPAEPFIDQLGKEVRRNFVPEENIDVLYIQEYLYQSYRFALKNLEFGYWRYQVFSTVNHMDASAEITILAENVSGISMVLAEKQILFDEIDLHGHPWVELIEEITEVFERAQKKSIEWNDLDIAPYIGPKPEAKKFFYDFKRLFDKIIEEEYNREFGYWGMDDFKEHGLVSLFTVMEAYEMLDHSFGDWTVWQEFIPVEEEVVWITSIINKNAPEFVIDTETKFLGQYAYDELLWVVERKNKELLRLTSGWNKFVGGG